MFANMVNQKFTILTPNNNPYSNIRAEPLWVILEMNSKEVTKQINSQIRPVLKENGFEKFIGRTYWRYREDRVDILNFQSFNSYHSEVMGCTTFSYSVNLSVFLNYIPGKIHVKEKNGLKRPNEAEGNFRKQLEKGMSQTELKTRDVWYVDNEGKNLSDCINDTKKQIKDVALGWYEKFNSKEKIMEILNKEEIDMNGTWGFGRFDSANRAELVAYTAFELDDIDLCLAKLDELLEFYKEQKEKIGFEYYDEQIKFTQSEIERIKTTHNNV